MARNTDTDTKTSHGLLAWLASDSGLNEYFGLASANSDTPTLKSSFTPPASEGFDANDPRAVAAAINTAITTPPKQAQTTTYTVKPGDTLSNIAKANGIEDCRVLGEQIGITTEAQARKLAIGTKLEIPANPNTHTSAPTATAQPSAIVTETLSDVESGVMGHGSRGFGVRQLQRDLNRVIDDRIGVDGIFEDETYTALKAYQEDNGLDPTGFLTPETADFLQAEIAALPPAPINGATASIVDSDYLLNPYLVEKMQHDPQAVEYVDMLTAAAEKYGLNPTLFVNQIFHESAHFDPDVINGNRHSSADAMGIAQFIKGTGNSYGLHGNDFFDPAKAIEAAAHHMSDLTVKFGGDQVLAMAGYNGGAGAVHFVQKQLGRTDITGEDWAKFMKARSDAKPGSSPSAWHNETRKYVGTITGDTWNNHTMRLALQQRADGTNTQLAAANNPTTTQMASTPVKEAGNSSAFTLAANGTAPIEEMVQALLLPKAHSVSGDGTGAEVAAATPTPAYEPG